MAKKKKMTKAQAAAARRDDKPHRYYTTTTTTTTTTTVTPKDDGPKSKDTKLFSVLIPIITIAVVVILSMVFTMGPGLLLNK